MAGREKIQVQEDVSARLSRGDQVLIPKLVDDANIPTFERPYRVECPSCRANVFAVAREWFSFGIGNERTVIGTDYVCNGCGKVYKREQLVER